MSAIHYMMILHRAHINNHLNFITGDFNMSIEVKIVKLEPIRVASSYGFGTGPEGIAWDKMATFIKEKGLDKLAGTRYFGFNNPSPAPGSANYGYEQWVTVGPEVEASGEVKIKTFPGGLYGVTHCRLNNIFNTWQELAAWREKSRYHPANHQWLEECFTPPLEGSIDENAMEFDLYIPIAE
jgi:DNA gyrase inhibitor GyrI